MGNETLIPKKSKGGNKIVNIKANEVCNDRSRVVEKDEKKKISTFYDHSPLGGEIFTGELKMFGMEKGLENEITRSPSVVIVPFKKRRKTRYFSSHNKNTF